jgi:phage N-6-adenine-methyltransferase
VVDAVLFSSVNTEHGTPQLLYDALDAEFRFDFDAAASETNRKSKKWLEGPCKGTYSSFNNCMCGLCADWMENTVFVNPPYGRGLSYRWVKKCWTASLQGATVVALLPARTDTTWFHNFVLTASEIRFICGRLTFEGNADAAPFPSMVVVWRSTAGRVGRVLVPAISSMDRGGVLLGA